MLANHRALRDFSQSIWVAEEISDHAELVVRLTFNNMQAEMLTKLWVDMNTHLPAATPADL